MKTSKEIKTRTKYVKHGVKRQHQLIEGLLPLLENIYKIDGVTKVNPGRISYSPKRGISQPTIKIQRRTITGFNTVRSPPPLGGGIIEKSTQSTKVVHQSTKVVTLGGGSSRFLLIVKEQFKKYLL